MAQKQEIEAQGGHEIAGVLEIALPIKNLAQPAETVGIPSKAWLPTE